MNLLTFLVTHNDIESINVLWLSHVFQTVKKVGHGRNKICIRLTQNVYRMRLPSRFRSEGK